MKKSEKKPIFGVLFPIQKKQIEAWCWGPGCGAGQIGAIGLGDGMPECVPCNKPECPFLEKQGAQPVGDVDGRPLYLRKLRDVDAGEQER